MIDLLNKIIADVFGKHVLYVEVVLSHTHGRIFTYFPKFEKYIQNHHDPTILYITCIQLRTFNKNMY